MRFFNIDYHISVIADIKAHFAELGHQVDSLCLSNHSWVFGKEKDRVPGLDGMSTASFGQRECDRFFQAEADNLAKYDGFIVTHTPCLAGLYERTGKPVICVVSTRYDTFCQTPESRAWLDDLLLRMHESGQLLLLANNAYDSWHVSKHLGISPKIIPSYCGYTGEFWNSPIKPAVLLGRWEFSDLARPIRGHNWRDVAQSACCVAVPYNASLMSIFERHTMGMPIAVPSQEWVSEHPHSLSELRHSGNPTSDEIEAAMRLADWYSGELPGITFFNSEDHLRDLLAQGIQPTCGMAARKERILESWKELLSEVSKHHLHTDHSNNRSISPAVDLSGFWRWSEGFVGELRPDGVLIQHNEATRDLRFGVWQHTEEGFDLDLTGHWHMSVKLSVANSGVWHLNGSPYPNGSIHRVGDSIPNQPSDEKRPYLNCDSFNRLAGDHVFIMCTESVLEWHRRCRPATSYSLVTNNSDRVVNGDFQSVLDDDLLDIWYATNAGIPHPKLRPIPIGVCHRHALKPDLIPWRYDRLLAAASRAAKSKQFSVSFTIASNAVERERCLKATGLATTTLDRASFIEDLGKSLYCISPEGNGMDCYRTWEALSCRSIPVITWNPMVNMGLYDGLPVVILDRWEDFDATDFTRERYERMMRGFDPNVLQIERWIAPPAASSFGPDQNRVATRQFDPAPSLNEVGLAGHPQETQMTATSLQSVRRLSRETPARFAGYYRWNELFYGEFLAGGTFFQHSVLNPSDKKPGKWWFDDGKLWFELSGYWTKYAIPNEGGPSPLFLIGHGEFGTLSTIAEADKYYAAPTVVSDTTIPKIIHACWFSGSELGDLQRKCIDSWKKHLPGYEIIIWDRSSWNPDQFLFSREAFENQQWAFVSDVHRLDVLYRFGGIYLDLDVEVRKSFDPLLTHEFFTGTEATNKVYLTNTPYIMGCKKNNKLVKEFLVYYNDRHFVNPDDTFDKRHNTSIIHETMMLHGARNCDNVIDEFIPGHFKYPSWVLAFDSHLTYAVHHFDNAWLRLAWSLPTRAARASVFRSIYDSNAWANGSGSGSTPEYTTEYREFLAEYMRRNRITSVLDVGCGDWQFSQLMDWSGIDYLGVDVVPEIIEANNRKFGTEGIRFEVRDFVEEEPPHADLVIVKDVLQHLSFASVAGLLEKFRKFDRVLIAQDVGGINHDCFDGGCRPLNVTIPPFNLAALKVFDFRKISKIAYEWRPGLEPVNRISELLTLLAGTVSGHTTRYGPKHDGGYAIPTLVYSKIITIGVGADARFESDYSNIHPETIFHFYDPTIRELPEAIGNSKFERIGLGSGLTRQLVPLAELLSKSEMGLSETILLKIDCEGGEWDCDFEKADLSRVAALVLEVHDIGDPMLSSIQFEVLSKLFSEFNCLNVHPNNYGGITDFNGIRLPRVLELSFLRKNISQNETNTPENHPCNPHAQELSTECFSSTKSPNAY